MEIVLDDGFGPSWDLDTFEERESHTHAVVEDHFRRDGPGASSGYYGECPLCNNSRGIELDRLCVSGKLAPVYRMGFTKGEVARHLTRHCGPVYARIGNDLFSDLTPEAVAEMKGRMSLVANRLVEAQQRRAYLDEMDTRRARREEHERKNPMGVASPRDARGRGTAQDGGGFDQQALERLVHDVLRARSRGYEAPRTYAFKGGRQLGLLAPWTHERSVIEMEERQRGAINFYDEMMDIRQKTRDIYDRIMGRKIVTRDEDGGERVEYEGGLVAADPKIITAAVGAVKAMAGVMDTLLDASLILKRIGDDSKGEELDPALKAIVDQIGLRSVGKGSGESVTSAPSADPPAASATAGPPAVVSEPIPCGSGVTVEIVEDARD